MESDLYWDEMWDERQMDGQAFVVKAGVTAVWEK